MWTSLGDVIVIISQQAWTQDQRGQGFDQDHTAAGGHVET